MSQNPLIFKVYLKSQIHVSVLTSKRFYWRVYFSTASEHATLFRLVL